MVNTVRYLYTVLVPVRYLIQKPALEEGGDRGPPSHPGVHIAATLLVGQHPTIYTHTFLSNTCTVRITK